MEPVTRSWLGAAARAAASLLATALFVSGCAGLDPDPRRRLATVESRLQLERERALNSTWVGRSRAELVREWGTPQGESAAPGRRLPHPNLLYYFGRDPVAGCIDSFVVDHDEHETIMAYVCR